MDKPLTARQFAMLFWGPIVVALIVWGIITVSRDSSRKREGLNAATNQALIDTERAGRTLQRNLDALNAQQTEGR